MPLQFTMTLAGKSSDKQAVAVANVIAPPTGDQIQCIITDTVDPYRRVEIMNSWKYLARGLAERDILIEFAGNIVYTGVPLNDPTSPKRKTSSAAIDITDGFVVLVVAPDLVTSQGDTVWLNEAFRQLFDFANEQPDWALA